MYKNLQTTLLCSDVDIRGIAPAKDGYIYFTTREDGLWRVRDDIQNSKPESIIRTTRLAGVVWDGNNLLCICDRQEDKIISYNIHTKELKDVSRMERPQGITIDKNGNLVITNHPYIHKIIVQDRAIELIAGAEPGYGHRDGPAHEAMFYCPETLVTGKDKTIYVADTFNYCIRKIKDGFVSTLAGTPGQSGYEDGIPGKFNMVRSLLIDENDNLIALDQVEFRRIDQNTGAITSFSLPKGLRNLFYAVQDSRGTIFVGANHGIVRLEKRWKWERFLWIGYLKEEASYCHLARLPRELVRVIASYLVIKFAPPAK